MKTRLFFWSGLLMLTIPCLAVQEYSNDALGFSLELPVGWNATPAENLPADIISVMENYYDSQLVAVCQKNNDKYLAYPSIQIQVIKFQRLSDSKNYKELTSKQGKEKLLKSSRYLAEHLIVNKISEFKLLDSGVKQLSNKHAIYAYKEYEHRDGRKLVAIVAKIIGSRKCITLRCYDRGESVLLPFLTVVEKVIDSIKFDNKAKIPHQLTEVITKVAQEDSKELTPEEGVSKMLQWCSTILGGLIVLWILKSMFSR